MSIKVPVEGRYISLVDVFVIGIVAASMTFLTYNYMSSNTLQHALNSVLFTTNTMVLLSVTGIMYFVVKRVK